MKQLRVLLILLCISVSIISCEKEEVNVEGVMEVTKECCGDHGTIPPKP